MSTTPHNDLVRAVLTRPEHAIGELRHLLPPELSRRIDWSTLEVVPGNYVDEALQDRESDILYRVRLDGQEVLLYLLLEHQSALDGRMMFRLLRYMVRFWDAWLEDHPDATKLPVVIPMLLCHAPSGWKVATRFEDLLDLDEDTRALVLEYVPKFRTLVDDLTEETDEALRARAMTSLGRLMLWCLKTARSTDDLVRGIASWAELFREVRRAPNGAAAIALLWQYVFSVHETLIERTLPALKGVLDEEQRQNMATWAEQLHAQGFEQGSRQGFEQGSRQGFEQGERGLLLRLLQRRFGPLPAEVVRRIEQAPASKLSQWEELMLTAATLAEVFDGPA